MTECRDVLGPGVKANLVGRWVLWAEIAKSPRGFRNYARAMTPAAFYRKLGSYRRLFKVIYDFHGRHVRNCPICGFEGYFEAVGVPLRYDAICKQCGSVERHRQFYLLLNSNLTWISKKNVLHLSPEQCLQLYLKQLAGKYVPADKEPGVGEFKVDIQHTTFKSNSFDLIICHQVLEHVEDDDAALCEMMRILRPGGVLVVSVPMVANWETTFERPGVETGSERDLYFGQWDHLRYYGRDFIGKLSASGYEVELDVAKEPNVAKFGLTRGETLFICRKPHK